MQRFWETVFDTLTGAAIKGAQVWLFHAADNSAAAIYTDAAGTHDAGNPLVSDANGYVQGYVADGLYNIEFRFAGVTLRTITDVPIFDLSDMRSDLDAAVATLAGKLDSSALSAFGHTLVSEPDAASVRTLISAYSKAEVDAAIAAIPGTNLSNYYTKAQVDAAIAAISIPHTLDALNDVDTSTVAPTDGQLLKFDAASGLWKPATVASGSGAGLTLIDSQTVANVAAIIFDNTKITNTYKSFYLRWVNVNAVTTAGRLQCQVSADNGTTWRNGNYLNCYENWSVTSSFSQYVWVNLAGCFILDNGISTDTTNPCYGEAWLYNLTTTVRKHMRALSVGMKGDGNIYDSKAAGQYTAGEVINAIRVFAQTGNISGTVQLYGVSY